MIGASDAKTHLSRLLQQVEAGETIVITRDGHPVAHLVPVPASGAALAASGTAAMVERWIEARKEITLSGIKVRDLINEGRR
jgi:prevent-host-death family protein